MNHKPISKRKQSTKGGKGKPAGLKDERYQLPKSGTWPSKKTCIQLVDYLVKRGRFNQPHLTRKKKKQNDIDNELTYQDDVRIVDQSQEKEQKRTKLYNLIGQRRNISNGKVKGVIVFFFECKAKPIQVLNGELVFPNNNDDHIVNLAPKYRDTLMLLKNMLKLSFQQELSSIIMNQENSTTYQQVAEQIMNDNQFRTISNCDEIVAASFLTYYENQQEFQHLTDGQMRQDIDQQYGQYIQSEQCRQDLQEFIKQILDSFEDEQEEEHM